MKLLRDLRILQNPSFSCFNSSNLNWGFLLISVYWFCYCRFLNFCYFCLIDSYYFSMKGIIYVFIFIFCCFHSFLNCSYMYIYLDIYIYIYISTLQAFTWKCHIRIYTKIHFLIASQLYFGLFKNLKTVH